MIPYAIQVYIISNKVSATYHLNFSIILLRVFCCHVAVLFGDNKSSLGECIISKIAGF